MAVYVDTMRARYGRLVLCHMLADTLEELNRMADRIGVARRWLQTRPVPHYDICLAKKKAALEAGAALIDRRAVAQLTRRLRLQGSAPESAQPSPQPGGR